MIIDVPEAEDLHWMYELRQTLVHTFWTVPVLLVVVLFLTA